MRQINCGIIGSSVAAFRHSHALNLNHHFSLKAIYSEDEKTSILTAKRHKIETVTKDSEYLLENEDIDLVVLALPTSLHLSFTLYALSFSKIVVVESPIVTSLVEWKKLHNAINDGAFVFNGNCFLYSPFLRKIRGQKGEFSLSLSYASIKRDEALIITLETLTFLFGDVLSVTDKSSNECELSAYISCASSSGKIRIIKDSFDRGLSFSFNGKEEIVDENFYYSIAFLYSHVYSILENGGDNLQEIECTRMALNTIETFFS